MEESHGGIPTSHLVGSVPAVISEEKSSAKYESPKQTCKYSPQIMEDIKDGDINLLEVRVKHLNNSHQTTRRDSLVNKPASLLQRRGTGGVQTGAFIRAATLSSAIANCCLRLGRRTARCCNRWAQTHSSQEAIWAEILHRSSASSVGGRSGSFVAGDRSTSWSFDVSYVSVAASSVYGNAVVVPLAYFFILQYLGSNAKLVPFWCIWAYSLSAFVPASFLLLIPVEILRWIIIIVAGTATASFVALNLKSYIEGSDLSVLVVAAFFLQIALAVFIKVWFFA
ncbi:Protein YIPF [Quillaja saponaria]|uniref:Protein YIPF n=1 Tax=Quillaja saponaria TaxID=32244 RepID=A0AAD7LL47_QUISA|nr:Protein YIPF [Quillaja saponaria]